LLNSVEPASTLLNGVVVKIVLRSFAPSYLCVAEVLDVRDFCVSIVLLQGWALPCLKVAAASLLLSTS
jgi:hypothetical protein